MHRSPRINSIHRRRISEDGVELTVEVPEGVCARKQPHGCGEAKQLDALLIPYVFVLGRPVKTLAYLADLGATLKVEEAEYLHDQVEWKFIKGLREIGRRLNIHHLDILHKS